MGSGKSTVAKALGVAKNCRHVDTDEMMERETGLFIHQYIGKHGLSCFRALERQICLRLMKKNDLIIPTGGGVPIHSCSIDEMRTSGRVIYLHCPIDVMWNRVQAQKVERPLAEIRSVFAERFGSREPIYRQADLIVDSSRPVEQIVDEILEIRSLHNAMDNT